MNKTISIANNLNKNVSLQKTVFKTLVGGICVLSFVYVYMIGSITFNVVARKSLENNMREVGSSVSNLELDYLAVSNGINKGFALSNGFVEAANPIFATRVIDLRLAVR
jgi:hypothetical protein